MQNTPHLYPYLYLYALLDLYEWIEWQHDTAGSFLEPIPTDEFPELSQISQRHNKEFAEIGLGHLV